jgi:hypothetical protein
MHRRVLYRTFVDRARANKGRYRAAMAVLNAMANTNRTDNDIKPATSRVSPAKCRCRPHLPAACPPCGKGIAYG